MKRLVFCCCDLPTGGWIVGWSGIFTSILIATISILGNIESSMSIFISNGVVILLMSVGLCIGLYLENRFFIIPAFIVWGTNFITCLLAVLLAPVIFSYVPHEITVNQLSRCFFSYGVSCLIIATSGYFMLVLTLLYKLMDSKKHQDLTFAKNVFNDPSLPKQKTFQPTSHKNHEDDESNIYETVPENEAIYEEVDKSGIPF